MKQVIKFVVVDAITGKRRKNGLNGSDLQATYEDAEAVIVDILGRSADLLSGPPQLKIEKIFTMER